VKMLDRIVLGEATPMDIDLIASVQQNIIGNCLCVLGDSMAAPVGAMVAKFRPEFEEALAAGTRVTTAIAGSPGGSAGEAEQPPDGMPEEVSA
jgi:NADH-quinone oxidoreductase subunit F